MEQSLMDKLTILADSAKYDVACTSSGASHPAKRGTIGSCYAPGCCHAFTADGRCVSLLKVLMSNCCAFDCSYCVNRKSNDVPRATFSPRELAELTIEFYRRNYIEGLFLSSAVLGTPDYTTERMLTVLRLLRKEYHFGGYIHAKTIPGTSPELIQQMGYLADRLSVNVELPSEQSLHLLAPDKGRHSIFRPMKQISVAGEESRQELTLYRHALKFAPAGQSTQMIVGASPETDYHILQLSEGMYQKYGLKRVFYSAYIPVSDDTRLPALDTKPPLLREHRLYQADWLLRFYQFKADEILDQDNQSFNPYLDPKCNWAVQHYGLFPVDVNRAPFEMLLRVPGIGPKSARRIRDARRLSALGLDELKRMGVVLKRAQYFITCRGFSGAHPGRGSAGRERITRALIDPNVFSAGAEQLSMFAPPAVDRLVEQGVPPRAAQRMVREEAVQCLARALRCRPGSSMTPMWSTSTMAALRASCAVYSRVSPSMRSPSPSGRPSGRRPPFTPSGTSRRTLPERSGSFRPLAGNLAGRRNISSAGISSPGRRTKSFCSSASCIWPSPSAPARSSGWATRMWPRSTR